MPLKTQFLLKLSWSKEEDTTYLQLTITEAAGVICAPLIQ